MHAASRDSLAAVDQRFGELTDGASDEVVRTVGDELSAVVSLLGKEISLRRHLADASAAESVRRSLVQRLFTGKVSNPTLELLGDIAGRRWSRSADLVDAIEHFARQAYFVLAERAGNLDEVEDELFRFGRVLDAQPRLRELLADETAPADRRVELLDGLIASKVKPSTKALLEQLVRTPRGRAFDTAVAELSERAAARRHSSIARVRAAAPLTTEQERRLADVLSRIYRREITVQVEVDEQVLGGLVISVGDELIDGSIAARLAKAQQELPN